LFAIKINDSTKGEDGQLKGVKSNHKCWFC